MINRVKEWLNKHLIDEWRFGAKFWSTRLQVLGGVLLLLSHFPDYAIQAFALLPLEIKSQLPKDLLYWLGLASIGGGVISRFLKQQKLDQERAELEAKRHQQENVKASSDVTTGQEGSHGSNS